MKIFKKNLLMLSREELSAKHQTKSGVIMHEIGHVIAYRRIGISTAYIAIHEDYNIGSIFAPSPSDTSEISIENQILIHASGVFMEKAIFGDFNVDTAYGDFMKIADMVRASGKIYPALTNRIDSGVPFAERLFADYGTKFPTRSERYFAYALHHAILKKLGSGNLIEGHRVIRFCDMPMLYRITHHSQSSALREQTKRWDRLDELTTSLEENSSYAEQEILSRLRFGP
ncbi:MULTISPECIES: hypothetical protein [Methylobacteriaceae]|jgi:hypothetical protein|uniref:Peptidase M48 domain-containing protein n=4 Tax=Methylobacteriaceae TaxID=119045 RepID=A0ABU9ZGJ3_9HYPH|nr:MULTISPECIES: hypothetical protein [Methylobacteriaceae]MBX9824367.1 hypothetical protein [Xanthobacteraceae bacterium]MBY0139874.1 hypothetical protein [Methylorubrum populi]MBZ6416254.1 hypothetical protein [Methylobacterium sp.]MDV2988240.1 hypothetical protein [Methylobacteriaceae bacterium AG10]MBK3395113.1 hypothetical protein [Methylobacterium ajmalii]